jgi:2-polyprenyl-6-methoxyphenol hydroxylase-like FAD-dependent oxidoreductase
MTLNVSIIGAGPAGLYLACLLKRSRRNYAVQVIEQNVCGSTFGFGLAFSQRALELLRRQDEGTWAAIWPSLELWNDSIVSLNGETVRIDGMGYGGIARLRLLQLLQEQAQSLGIHPQYGRVVQSPDEFDADLVVGADGANSVIRRFGQQRFGTSIAQFGNRFAWFGTRARFDVLTHTFIETRDGAFNAHHHPHAPDMGTFVVEMDEATFNRCGFEHMPAEKAQSFCESIFAPVLKGAPLISNKSIWRRFPRIWNTRWSYDNRVLLGDAAHTAHFSIGSGTRLAIEDALALSLALDASPNDIRAALTAFEDERKPKVERLVAAADASAQWYENFASHMRLPLMEFAMCYITRSGRVGEEQLRNSSAAFMAQYDAYRRSTGESSDRI